MSLWRDKTNRTILLSSIFLIILIALLVFLAAFDRVVNPDIPGLNWLFNPAVILVFGSLIFWGIYFNMLLLIGTIREKMNALPGWTEVVLSMIITLLPAILIGNLPNFAGEELKLQWIVFGGAALGVIIITLWFLMSSTPKETTVKG
ncbi:MAG: hypothetical protein ACTSXA_14170 [Candidatus Heimdallarchaeota archaeon]